MARLQKKFIAQAKKTVSSSQWKKRGLKTAWRLQRKAKGTRKGQVRKTSRRAFTKSRTPRRNKTRRKRTMSKMRIPHPSVTGMAAGFTILNYLNDADGGYSNSVLNEVSRGDYQKAFKRLMSTSRALVKWPSGKKALGESIGIAVIGAGVRKVAGNPKLGFSNKLYFRI